MMFTLRLIIALGLIGLFAWPLPAALRTGKVRIRGKEVSRKKQPVQFWLAIAIRCAAILLVVIGLMVAPTGLTRGHW